MLHFKKKSFGHENRTWRLTKGQVECQKHIRRHTECLIWVIIQFTGALLCLFLIINAINTSMAPVLLEQRYSLVPCNTALPSLRNFSFLLRRYDWNSISSTSLFPQMLQSETQSSSKCLKCWFFFIFFSSFFYQEWAFQNSVKSTVLSALRCLSDN